jgi:RNA polymerase sigma-70 factor, ECF subfamily
MLTTDDERTRRAVDDDRAIDPPSGPPGDSGFYPVDTQDSTEGVITGSFDWEDLVDRIRLNDPSGLEELYRLFSKGIRFYLCRQLGPQELDDKVHDTFLIVVQTIQRGELRDPDRLMGFIRTIVRRQVAAHIDQVIHTRRGFTELESGFGMVGAGRDPEENAILQQKSELMERILRSLSRRDREILTRFYLHEQPQEQICEEMSLTETQFRLLKSRAKTRFGEIGRKRILRRPIRSYFSAHSSMSA